MLEDFLKNINTIYIACGVTDFRMQSNSLCNMIKNKFKMNPFKKIAFIFCNRKRNSIKVLCYDKNGFILAQKTLLNTNKMKFQWPRNTNELKNISKQQLNWLLSGLKVEQKTSFKDIELDLENTAN